MLPHATQLSAQCKVHRGKCCATCVSASSCGRSACLSLNHRFACNVSDANLKHFRLSSMPYGRPPTKLRKPGRVKDSMPRLILSTPLAHSACVSAANPHPHPVCLPGCNIRLCGLLKSNRPISKSPANRNRAFSEHNLQSLFASTPAGWLVVDDYRLHHRLLHQPYLATK